jgi:hypothetical protein
MNQSAMMRRFVVLLILGGGSLAVYAVREMILCSGARSEPSSVDLARLEAGDAPESEIGRAHV